MIYPNYLFTFIIALFAFSCNQGNEVDPDISGKEADQILNIYPIPPSKWMGTTNPYFTGGWVGDIMPYYEDGKFHIFFLHDAQIKPHGEGFHAIHKFESSDLLNFTYEGEMIPFGSADEPDFAIGTGSVIKINGTYYFYYTGHNGIPAFMQKNPRESILLATGTDLHRWTKDRNFKITAPPAYFNYEFRDPHVFYNEEKEEYWMLQSSQFNNSRRSVVMLYTSKDPVNEAWKVQDPLYVTSEEDNYLMMECADVFKMGNYWYMFISENWSGNKGTHYRIATSSSGPWMKLEHDMLDGEFFYAAKTASDGNRRYAFGWTARRYPENDTGNKEWAGNMVIHELTQEADGTLGVKVPDIISEVLAKEVPVKVMNSTGIVSFLGNTYQLNGSNAEALYTFEPISGTKRINAEVKFEQQDGEAGFVFNAGNTSERYYKIVLEPKNSRLAAYHVNKGNPQLITRVPVSLQIDTAYNIDVVIEDSICVVYINGKAALSNRIYGLPGNHWGIISKGTTVAFEKLKLFNSN